MTRLERAAEKVRKAKAMTEALEQSYKQQRADQREAERQAEAVARLEAKKALTRRRYAVGYLAERAGLFAYDDATLAELFAFLATDGLALCATAKSLTAQGVVPSESSPDQRENSELPAFDTSDESDWKEARRKGLPEACTERGVA